MLDLNATSSCFRSLQLCSLGAAVSARPVMFLAASQLSSPAVPVTRGKHAQYALSWMLAILSSLSHTALLRLCASESSSVFCFGLLVPYHLEHFRVWFDFIASVYAGASLLFGLCLFLSNSIICDHGCLPSRCLRFAFSFFCCLFLEVWKGGSILCMGH